MLQQAGCWSFPGFYNGVKNYSAFADAIKMLEANPASKNNRSVSQPPAST